VTVVDADWPLVPDGLAAGDQFRLVFSTSEATRGSHGDAGHYRRFVQRAASVGHRFVHGHAERFLPLVAVAGSGVRRSAGIAAGSDAAAVPVYWLGGALAAASAEALLGGDWAGERRDENGRLRADRWHWTGRHPGGGHRLGEDRPGAGAKRLDSGGALDAGRTFRAARKLPVYAISGVFEVAEPRRTADPGGDGIEFFQNNVQVVLAVDNTNVNEGDNITISATVVMGTVPSGGGRIGFSVSYEKGASAADITLPSSTQINLPAGTTESGVVTVSIPTVDDDIDEPSERIRFEASSSPAWMTLVGGEFSTATATIRDNDPTPVAFNADDRPLYEDDTDGPRGFSITLARSLAAAETAVVTLAITGTNGADNVTVALDAGSSDPGVTYNPATRKVSFARPSGGDTDGDGTVDSDDEVSHAELTVTPTGGEDGDTADGVLTITRDTSESAVIAGGISLSPGEENAVLRVIDAGEVLAWTDLVPLTAQPAGWPAIGIDGLPLVDDTTGEHNYWLGRDMWIEPGTSPHAFYIWLTKPAHEDVLLYLSSPVSDTLISLSETGSTAQSKTVTISAGDGPCTGTGSTRVFYGGPYGCAIPVYVHRSVAAHQSGCRSIIGSADNSVFGDGVITTALGTVRVAMPQTHLNAGDTSRDWTTTKNSRANAYKTGGVCHAAGGRITPNRPPYPG